MQQVNLIAGEDIKKGSLVTSQSLLERMIDGVSLDGEKCFNASFSDGCLIADKSVKKGDALKLRILNGSYKHMISMRNLY